jgi:hypothetical protein
MSSKVGGLGKSHATYGVTLEMPGNSANSMRLNVCALAELEIEIAKKNKTPGNPKKFPTPIARRECEPLYSGTLPPAKFQSTIIELLNRA